MSAAEAALLAPFATAFAFLFGLNVGSFLNVVAHRLPLGLSVVRPRSRCPGCLTPIAARDNIPVISWALLRGRCRGCKGRISARYAAVELLCGALAAWIAYAVVAGPGRLADGVAWAHAGVVFVAMAAMLAASLIDLDHRILPDQLTIPGMWCGPAVAAFVPELVLRREARGGALELLTWLPQSWPVPLHAAVLSAIGVAVGGGVIWGLGAVGSRVLGKEAMGFGDVKFLAAIGGFAGPMGAVVALLLAALLGSVVGIARTIMTGDRYMPFGPFLAVGGLVAMLHGADLVASYVRTVMGG
ncbi:MAG: prepilin peptidase [Planctomycetes bacterium]|nr:prepilin peptidase [Planctomycetota bacterium]